MRGWLGRRPAQSALLHIFGEPQVATSVVVAAIFLLQVFHQLAQRLALFGHDIGQQQCIQRAIALDQESGNADAA